MQISQVRALGGDVSVSFGGEAGSELAQVVTNVRTLTADYQQVITAYGLTHIEFDIEGAAASDDASIDRRSQAIAALQQAATATGKTLDLSFTLPVLPTGLTANGLYVLQSALKYGVRISLVNVMAMDYGDSAAPNPAGQMGTYAIAAAKSTFGQLRGLYGTTLTASRLWAMVGVIPMIGVNDQADEVFGFSDASQLLAFAESVGMGEISMWSLGRDQEDPAGALTYAEEKTRARSSRRLTSSPTSSAPSRAIPDRQPAAFGDHEAARQCPRFLTTTSGPLLLAHGTVPSPPAVRTIRSVHPGTVEGTRAIINRPGINHRSVHDHRREGRSHHWTGYHDRIPAIGTAVAKSPGVNADRDSRSRVSERETLSLRRARAHSQAHERQSTRQRQ